MAISYNPPTPKPEDVEEPTQGQSSFERYFQSVGSNAQFFGIKPEAFRPRYFREQAYSYWENPQRIARYRQVAAARPPDNPMPEWYDEGLVEEAYQRMRTQNQDEPWWSWKPLPYDDPVNRRLQSYQPPPPEFLWPGEEKYSPKPEEELGTPEMGGMTQEQIDALPLWQKLMIPLLSSPPAAGAVLGGAIGAFGGPLGVGIGAALGAGIGVAGERAPGLANALMVLDYPAEILERAFGVLELGYGRGIEATREGGFMAGADAVAEVLNNLPAAWQAARFTYETAPDIREVLGMGPSRTQFLGVAEPVILRPEQTGATALYDIFNRVRQGADLEDIYNDVQATYGFEAMSRELLGHVLLDPLNVTGLTTARLAGVAADVLGKADAATAFKAAKGPIEAIQLYGKILRSTRTTEEVSQLNSFARWLGGVTAGGDVRALQPAGKGVLSYLFNLTPQARATEVVNNGAVNLALILERAGDDPAQMVKYIHGLSQTPDALARELSMRSILAPDGAAIPMALKEFSKTADNMLAGWEASRWQASMLDNIAQVTGRSTSDILQQLGKEGIDGEAMLRQFVDLARQADTDEARAVVAAYDDARQALNTLPPQEQLTVDNLRGMHQTFEVDGLPKNADEFRAGLYAAAMETTAEWSAKWFNVKPDPTWVRLSNMVKSAQSLALLGLNPTYFVNNLLNNVVTSAASGVFGLRSGSTIVDIWQRAGVIPPRLRAGIGAHALGAEIDYTAIRQAMDAPGMIQDATRLFSEKGSKIAIFSQLSAKAEQWSSAQAYTSGFLQAWGRLWKRGKGYNRMPPQLERMLNGLDPHLSNLVYGAIEGGMNQAEVEARLFAGFSRRSIDSVIPDIAAGLKERGSGLSETDISEVLRHSGVYDELATGLAAAGDDDAKIIEAFRAVDEKIADRLDDLTVRDLESEASKVAARVGPQGEGAIAILDVFDNLNVDFTETWFDNIARWEDVFQKIETMELGGRNAVVNSTDATVRKAWDRHYKRAQAGYLGISQGLGIENGQARDFLKAYDAGIANHKTFFNLKRDLLNQFFRTDYGDDITARNLAWDTTRQQIAEAASEHYRQENLLQLQMDGQFAAMIAKQFGDAAGEAALAWRRGVMDIRDRMMADMTAFQNEIYKLPADERRLAWLDFYHGREGWLNDISDMFKTNTEGARNLYDTLLGGGAEARPAPEPPPQPLPPEPVALTNDWAPMPADAEPPPGAQVRMDLETGEMVARQPGIRPDLTPEEAGRAAEARAIAQEFGVPTSTEAGEPISGSNIHILNIVKKYGDKAVNRLEDADPDLVRRAFEERQRVKDLQMRLPEPEGAEAAIARLGFGVVPEEEAPLHNLLVAFRDKGDVPYRDIENTYAVKSGQVTADQAADYLGQRGINVTDRPAVAREGGRRPPVPKEVMDAWETNEFYKNQLVELKERRKTMTSQEAAAQGLGGRIQDTEKMARGAGMRLSAVLKDSDLSRDDVRLALEAPPVRHEPILDITPERPPVEVPEIPEQVTRFLDQRLTTLDLPPAAMERIVLQFDDILGRIEFAEPGRRVIEEGKFIRAEPSTFPDWYRDMGGSSAYYKGTRGKQAIVGALRAIGAGEEDASVTLVQKLKQLALDQVGNDPAVRQAMGAEFDPGPWIREMQRIQRNLEDELFTMIPENLERTLYEDLGELLVQLPEDADPAAVEWVLSLQERVLAMMPAEPVPAPPPGTIDVTALPELTRQFIRQTYDREKLTASMLDAHTSTRSPELLPAGDARQVLRDVATRLYGLSDEEADAVLAITDARARRWAADNATTPAEWYRTRIAGGAAGAPVEGLFQIREPQDYQVEQLRQLYAGSPGKITGSPKWVNAAIDEFGLTYDPREAGYILPDGNMLDFSGKREGGTPGMRSYDHRQIGFALEEFDIPDDEVSSMVRFAVNTNSMRVSYIGGDVFVDIYAPPTNAQMRQLRSMLGAGGLTWDVTDAKGLVVATGDIDRPRIGSLTALREYAKELFEGEGVPSPPRSLFQEQPGKFGRRGAVEFLDDGRAIIRAISSPDVSTMVHEVGHIFRRDLEAADLRTAEEWAGVTAGAWERPHEEKFARAFERYLAEGLAPTPELTSVFEKFKRWLLSIYNRVTGSAIDVEITPEMRGVFDRLLAEEAYTPPGQMEMFGAGQDLPLFSGTAQRAQAEAFRPGEVARQESMFPLEMEGARPGGEVGGPIFEQMPDVDQVTRAAEDVQFLIVKGRGMATKSSVEDYLIKRFGIDRGLAHDVMNQIETKNRQTFVTRGNEVFWNQAEMMRPEPKPGDYPGLTVEALFQEPRLSDAQFTNYLDAIRRQVTNENESLANRAIFARRTILDETDQARRIQIYRAIREQSPEVARVLDEQMSQWFSTDGGPRRVLYQDGDGAVVQGDDGKPTRITEGDDPPAMNLPLGSVDGMHTTPDLASIEEQGFRQNIRPIMAALEERITGPGARIAEGAGDLNNLTPEAMRELRSWLGGVYGNMSDTKLAATRWGENRRDAALHNYSRRYGFDNVLTAIFPYQFWYTRTAFQWALRALDRPGWLANYARIRNLQRNTIKTPGFPTRLRDKMRIPLPFLPEWAGGGVYVDPFRQLFPFEQLSRPWEQYGEQKNFEERKAEYILDQLVDDDEITSAEATAALRDRSGPAWERAMAQARLEVEGEITNPLDFAFLMIGPSLPISWAYYGLTGRKENIGSLPVSRLVRTMTGMFGANQGLGWNPEGPIRRALGLPEVDRFQDFRVDRMLANLAAEGYPAEEINLAMVEKSGPLYLMAQQRVARQAQMTYAGAPLGADLFPEGEQEQRALKNEYDRARSAWLAGDNEAMNKFFEKYPEYESRMLAFQDDPEERLRRFLISDVWDAYMNINDLHKRQLREQLGDTFTQAFLNKETRSYDAIDTPTLTLWAQTMKARVPSTAPGVPDIPIDLAPPEIVEKYQAYTDARDYNFPGLDRVFQSLYSAPERMQNQIRDEFPILDDYYSWRNRQFAENPEIIPYLLSDKSKMAGAPPEITAKYYQFQTARDTMFPDIFTTQNQYFELASTSAKKKFRADHPELVAYWDWRRGTLADNPELIPYVMSSESISEMMFGDFERETRPGSLALPGVDISKFPAPLVRQLMGHFYADEQISTAGGIILRREWEAQGRPGEDFNKWVETAVAQEFATPP